MSRISKVPLSQWSKEFSEATQSQVGIMPILAHVPKVGAAVAHVYTALAETRALPKQLLELVRLRIAYRNQCRTCMAVRYGSDIGPDASADAVCALEEPIESSVLSPAEKIAVEYADKMCVDHLSVDEAFFSRLREHFTEAEMVELAVTVAILLGFGRFAATLHLVDHLPAEYREETGEPIAPWRNSGMAVTR